MTNVSAAARSIEQVRAIHQAYTNCVCMVLQCWSLSRAQHRPNRETGLVPAIRDSGFPPSRCVLQVSKHFTLGTLEALLRGRFRSRSTGLITGGGSDAAR